MAERDGIPGELAANGRMWKKNVYNDGNRHQWFCRMTDDEIREHTNGRVDGFDDFDGFIAWNVTDYPVYLVELHIKSQESYEVTARRTYFSRPRPGFIEGLGGKYNISTDSKEKAVQTVRNWVEELS